MAERPPAPAWRWLATGTVVLAAGLCAFFVVRVIGAPSVVRHGVPSAAPREATPSAPPRPSVRLGNPAPPNEPSRGCRKPGELLWLESFHRQRSDGFFVLAAGAAHVLAAGYTDADGAATFPSRAWLVVVGTDGELVTSYVPDLPGPIRSATGDEQGPAVVPFTARGGAHRLRAGGGSSSVAIREGSGATWIASAPNGRMFVASSGGARGADAASSELLLRALDARSEKELWRFEAPFETLEAAHAVAEQVAVCSHGGPKMRSGWLGLMRLDAHGKAVFTRRFGHARPDGCTDLALGDNRTVVLGTFGARLTMDGSTLLEARPDAGDTVDSFLLVLDAGGQPESVLRLDGSELDAQAVAVFGDGLFVAGSAAPSRPAPGGEVSPAMRPRFEQADHGPLVRRIDARGKVEWQWPEPASSGQRAPGHLGVVRDLMPWRGLLLAAGSYTGTRSAADPRVESKAGYDGFIAALCP